MHRQLKTVALVIGLGIVLLGGLPSEAERPPGEDGQPPDPPDHVLKCLGDTTVSSYATPPTIASGQSTTLHWSVSVPSGCGALQVYFGPEHVNRTGSRTVQPIATTTYNLRATFAGGSRHLPLAPITIKLDPIVTINANHLERLFIQALGEKDSFIIVENHVELDLSHRNEIQIADGVTVEGGRTAHEAGPRLYTTTNPSALFYIVGDKVRITGVRIEGPDMGVAESTDSTGIFIDSRVNVEIDNNELSGWSHAAVYVHDGVVHRGPVRAECMSTVQELEEGGMGPVGCIKYPLNHHTIHIHDNYIHHNQHRARLGYGVLVAHGAYARIERNVFDWNRHAIAGDGREGTGYVAYGNLVLEHGGYHDTYNACDYDRLPEWVRAAILASPLWGTGILQQGLCLFGGFIGFDHYTHQFDMHGRDTCGIKDLVSDTSYNCGPAGEYMDIRHNTFFYTKGHAFKLRGTPTIGADVASNVFRHTLLFDDLGAPVVNIGALAETESGLEQWDNLVGVNGMNELVHCDFDGDGLDDAVLATGQTVWYSSGDDRPWEYLATSPKRHPGVLAYSADGRCFIPSDIDSPGGPNPEPDPGNDPEPDPSPCDRVSDLRHAGLRPHCPAP